MGKMIEWFKAHPLAAGLIVFGVGLVLVLALFGGSSNSGASTVITGDNSDVGANSALTAAQLNANVQIATAQINANTTMAGYAAATQMNKDNNDAAITGINVQADTSTKIATLQAANDAAAIQASKDINDSQMTAGQAIALINAGATTTIAGLQAQVANNQTAAGVTIAGLQQQVANNSIAASIAINANNNATAQAMNANNNATQIAVTGLNNNTAIQINRDNLGSIANAINIASADQWGGGFVNPGIAAYLAAAGAGR